VQRAVATTIATTTPQKAMLSLWWLKFASGRCAVVQNAVASASVASSPTPAFAYASISALSGVDVAAAGLKAKLYNLGLDLKDNTHSQFPIAV
jgi:hypothetical protein